MDSKWKTALDERQQKEVEFAQVYAEQFHHGTTGHNQLMLIALLAKLLDQQEAVLWMDTTLPGEEP